LAQACTSASRAAERETSPPQSLALLQSAIQATEEPPRAQRLSEIQVLVRERCTSSLYDLVEERRRPPCYGLDGEPHCMSLLAGHVART
jgi:hypothetical protein